MRIQDGNLPQKVATQQAAQLAKTNTPSVGSSNRASEATTKSDSGSLSRMRISPNALLASQIASAISSRPTLRTELVERLSAQVANGTYQPDPKAIASGLVASLTGRRV